ncbi:MAG TPA: response regulator [Gemmatimonadaceae bacterium]|jgi:DNA-binding NtrC family response regulator
MTENSQATRVLVVDDEHSICRALEISFRRAGYYVRAVESAEDAVQLLHQEHFDCLVVDLRMPEMGGDELFEIAASVQPHLRQRTIITTGDGSERAHELIAACGCASLGKPFDLGDLLDLTRQLTLRMRDARA